MFKMSIICASPFNSTYKALILGYAISVSSSLAAWVLSTNLRIKRPKWHQAPPASP